MCLVRAVHKFDSRLLIKKRPANGEQWKVIEILDRVYVSSWKVFEMWCWRRMEKISWTDHMRNEEVSLIVKEYPT